MEQGSSENNRKDDECDDKENEHDEDTTSNAEINDPSQSAHNVNDLKTQHINAADKVRQVMKVLIKDKNLVQSEDSEYCSFTENTDTEMIVKNNVQRINQTRDNDEATTSNAEVNLWRTANEVNDLETLDVNSADEVRQAMKVLFKEKNRLRGKDGEYCKWTETINQESVAISGGQNEQLICEKVIVDVNKVHNDMEEEINQGNRNIRKRPGRPSNPGPAKKIRKINPNIFYYGKLTNLVFIKRKYRHDSSSDDE